MKQTFIEKNFRARTLATIAQADAIITEYQAQGFTLTLRQLYYQFVARDLLPNTERSYKSLGKIISDARMAGYLDWDAIEDRTRNLKTNLRLRDPRHGLELLRDQWYGIDMWANQPTRVEVWIEKEALAGVVQGVCEANDVPFFSCRGYVSQSEQYSAGMRYRSHYNRSAMQSTIVLHLGDHDPSGIDMTRDNRDRLGIFAGYRGAPEVKRIALNMDQVEEYGPPPNPGKVRDPRFEDYFREFGDESWELDALEPQMMVDLIQTHIDEILDLDLWNEREAQLQADKQQLSDFIEQLDD